MDAKLNLSRREQLGRKAKPLVQEGQVLGNIFGKGEESIAVYGEGNVVERIVKQAGKNHPIDIVLDDGKEILVLVSEVERDSLTRRMHHVAFQIIKRGEKVSTEVPIHQVGDSPAVRAGMIIVTLMDRVVVEAIPSKIPDALEVSIEGLVEDGDQVNLGDIKMPEGAELQAEIDMPIAKIETPRAAVEDEPEEGEEEVDAGAVPSDHGSSDDDSSNS